MYKYRIVLEHKITNVEILGTDDGVVSISTTKASKTTLCNDENMLLCMNQIVDYLDGENVTFSFKYILDDTSFKKDVYKTTMNIPYGSTLTYSDVAVIVGRPRASRAVGTALKKTKLMFLIPAHRVVSKNGIGGFDGDIPLKYKLLELEKRNTID